MKKISSNVKQPPPQILNIYSDLNLITSFEKISYSTGSAGFLGISLLQIVSALFSIQSGMKLKSLDNGLGAAVNLIAGIHYMWMRENYVNKMEVVSTRFSDWYITTILMLIEFFNLSDTLVINYRYLIGACIANTFMLIFGHIATIRRLKKQSFYVIYSISIIFGVILGALVLIGTVNENHPNVWMYVFLSIWILYPIAFIVKSELFYNILDFISKGFFGITLSIITFTSSLK